MAEACRRCGGSGIQPGHELWDNSGLHGPACRECGGSGLEHQGEGGCVITILAKLFVFVVMPIFALLVVHGLYVNLTQRDGSSIDATATDPKLGPNGEVTGSCIRDVDAEQIAIVGCEVAHEAEVYRVVGIDVGADVERPAKDDLTAFARSECRKAVLDYFGGAPSEVGMSVNWFVPSETGWAKGKRSLSCVALKEPGHQATTGSIRGTAGN